MVHSNNIFYLAPGWLYIFMYIYIHVWYMRLLYSCMYIYIYIYMYPHIRSCVSALCSLLVCLVISSINKARSGQP